MIDQERDRRREREFYTYYDAYCALSTTEPPFTDLYDATAAARHKPKPAPDATLTAFCQLGALRMSADRCMVFFFDQTNGYVLAESTKSHHSGHADDLWLGCTVIPRGLSVCEHTVNIPAANKGSNQYFQNAGDIHIINDLREDVRFHDRPYVHERPNARFYAGVPIKTPNGANIGAYCVLDDRPRNGLGDEDVDFLVHMASLVMDHLGHLRTSAEYGRGAMMLEGLGVISRHEESTARSCESFRQPKSREVTAKSSLKQSEGAETHTELLSEYASDFVTELDDRPRRKRTLRKRKEMGSVATSQRDDEAHLQHDAATSAVTVHASSTEEKSSTWYSSEHGSSAKPLDCQIRDSFQTTSSLLLDAIKSDGVLFLNAIPSTCSNHSVKGQRLSGIRNTSAMDDSDSSTTHTVLCDHARENPDPKCEILGHSEVNDSAARPVLANMINEKFLKALIRRYPCGKTWTFDAEGQASSDDLLESFLDSEPEACTTHPPESAHAQSLLKDAARLQKLFRCTDSSRLRTLCFAPMWDLVRGRWYAAVLTWSKSARHGFSRNNELSYLRAFCDVTMAEVLRIEAKHEAKAKSRLLSSVSHELRSPLHGILGSIDLLKGNATLDWSLIEQIQKCSLNLVDVIDHLLDFAQINSKAPNSTGSLDKLAKNPPANKPCTRISLARTTEEIIDAVYYADYFANRDKRRSRNVVLILDLAPASARECLISVGAWKRLCTNIVNNALKYTHEGHVTVHLDVIQREDGKTHAALTVADTGVGMSPEFLKTRLFKAFAQEDPLVSGTGLGMSLVAQLIRDFRGTIEVQSEKGEGTKMNITIPLDDDSKEHTVGFGAELACRDCRVGFWRQSGPAHRSTPDSRSLLIDAVKRTLQTLRAAICEEADADIIVIMEEDLDQLSGNCQARGEQFWLVLCQSFVSAARLRDKSQNCCAQFIPQPYGPERLSLAVRSLIKSKRIDSIRGSRKVSQEIAEDDKVPLQLSREDDESYPASVLPSPPLDKPLGVCPLGGSFDITPENDTKDTIEPGFPFPGVLKGKQAVTGDQAASTSPSKGPAEQIQAEETPQQRKPLILLLVDDNPINLKLLTLIADRNRYPRLLATNGQEALDTYKSSIEAGRHVGPDQASQDNASPECKPSVVLLDLNMPVMDGFEAARQIRLFEKKIGVSPAVIVAITGLGDGVARARAYEHGVNLFLSKPVRPQDLTEMLNSIVNAKDE